MFRHSSHSLAIETGRYQGILDVNRVCKFCKDDIEDEFHFILKCLTYQYFRSSHIKSYYRTRQSVLVRLLSTENVKELCNLGKFPIIAYKLRENLNSVKLFKQSLYILLYVCSIISVIYTQLLCIHVFVLMGCKARSYNKL